MFEKATRLKLRFPSQVGMLSVEDLWDLPLQSSRGASLDTIAKTINKVLKETSEESFVAPVTAQNTELTLQLDILKYIIAVKIEEANAAKVIKEKAAKKRDIMAIMADKQNEALKGKSLEELQVELDSL